ncbi:MAG: proton-conducting transporter membrane subunit, partial [Nitrospirota bacterium]|nr:proton-conducting transporter membrane subunit [Nitrospirota bacterium]
LVAYSSISHMGFVTLGIFVFNNHGIQGAILQMVNHGITTGALFLAVGQLYDRTHSRSIQDYGGLQKSMPRFVALFCLFSVASFGLPGTCNFIGEFLVLVGTSFESYMMVLLSMGGIVLAAAYMLWMLQRVVLGHPKTPTVSQLSDLSMRELATVIPLAILILWIGVYPSPLMEMMDSSVTHLVQHMAQFQKGMVAEAVFR